MVAEVFVSSSPHPTKFFIIEDTTPPLLKERGGRLCGLQSNGGVRKKIAALISMFQMPGKKDYIEKLHKGAKPSTFKNAAELRQHETEAEKKLWQLIRNRQLKGKKFRRQHALDDYVLDFYCHECRLAIELDGGVHDLQENQQYDAARTNALNECGLKVIRFRNEEVMNEAEKILIKIAEHLYP